MPEQNSAEDPLARSFDAAMARFIKAEGTGSDTPEHRGLLAARLLVIAKLGETDEEMLAYCGALYLRAFAAAMKITASSKAAPAAAGTPAAFEPEVIDAMALAFERCIEELPDGGANSTVRAFLQKAIMEAATAGEGSSERLQAAALSKLKARR